MPPKGADRLTRFQARAIFSVSWSLSWCRLNEISRPDRFPNSCLYLGIRDAMGDVRWSSPEFIASSPKPVSLEYAVFIVKQTMEIAILQTGEHQGSAASAGIPG